jgi:polysaccharide biosynthesis transport protein
MARFEYKGTRIETVRIFFRYLPLFLVIVILSTAISIISNLTKDDYFAGSLQLMVTPKSDQIELVRASRYQTTISFTELMNTELEFIQSWPIVQEAASLADHNWKSILNSDTKQRSQLMSGLRSRLWVAPVKNSTMLRIGFTDSDPERLASFLNQLGEQYAAARTSVEEDTSSIGYYTEKIAFVNSQLDSLQSLRADLLSDNNLVDPQLEMPTHLQRYNQIIIENENLDQQIAQSTDLLERLATGLDHFEERGVLVLPVLSRGNLEELKSVYYEKQREMTALRQKYQDNYFEIGRLEEELALLKVQLVSEIHSLRDAELGSHQGLLNQRLRNRDVLQEQTDFLTAYPQLVTIVEQLELEIDNRKKMLGVLTDKLSEYQLANPNIYANVDVTIVDPALVPSSPSGPRRVLSVVITFILSLVISILLMFLLDIMSNRYNSAYQLIMDLRLPVIASIPEIQE